MEGHSGAAARISEQGAGARSLRLLINPPRLQLDDRTVIFKYTGDGGWFCASFGDGAKYMRAAEEDPTLRERIAKRAQNIRRGRDALGPDLARVMAAVELSKDYDPDQPRDEKGRWTREGGGAVAAGAVADAFNLYGAPSAAAGLRALAQRALGAAAALLPEGAAAVGVAVVGSAAVLGTLFLPINRASVATGTLPDAPEFSYKYNQDTGRLTVTRQNADGTADTVFAGHHDKDAVFRDENGNAIGRYLGDSVALDADAVRGYEARRRSDAQAPPGAIAQSTARTRSDPEVCPDPSSDKPGRKDPGAVAYQMYVQMFVNGEPLEEGLGIRMIKPDGEPVYFDDCRRRDDGVHPAGSLVEAKGYGFSEHMNSDNAYPWFGMLQDMLDQSASQIAAAGGRPIEWYFAEEDVANYMSGVFARLRPGITVHYLQAPPWVADQIRRVAEGGWYELSNFIDMLSKSQGSLLQAPNF
jgi:hypothetical protein